MLLWQIQSFFIIVLRPTSKVQVPTWNLDIIMICQIIIGWVIIVTRCRIVYQYDKLRFIFIVWQTQNDEVFLTFPFLVIGLETHDYAIIEFLRKSTSHGNRITTSIILVLGSLNLGARIFLDEITTSIVDSLHTILPSDSLTSTCHRIDPPHFRANICLTAIQNIDRQSKLDCNNRILFCHFQAQTRIPLLVMQEIERSTPLTSLGSCCEFTSIHGFLITILAQDKF